VSLTYRAYCHAVESIVEIMWKSSSPAAKGDAQKVLIAAQESKLLSDNDCTEISKRFDLGLDWSEVDK
jgi:hypothetical protein